MLADGSNVRDIFFDLYDRHERLRSARLNSRIVRSVTVVGNTMLPPGNMALEHVVSWHPEPPPRCN